jgi:hypothetical protein
VSKHEIDWSVFDGEPERICYCYCGHSFNTHAKLIKDKSGTYHITRKKCYICGKNDNSRIIRDTPEPEMI